jgi:hypothetical protein
MKTKMNTYLLTFALLGSALVLNSCGKEDDPDNTGGGPKANYVQATIGTKAIDPVGAPIVNFDNGTLDFTVLDKDQVTTLAVYVDINGANTQSFAGGSSAFANVQISSTTEGLYTADGGSITMTTNDKANRIVEGTFAFSAKNTNSQNIDVSNGKFYLKY